jgi:hypothetical protein
MTHYSTVVLPGNPDMSQQKYNVSMTNIQEKKLKNANSTSNLLTGPKQGHVHKLGHWHILEDRRECHFCVTSVN